MAAATGNSIAAFITGNAAVTIAENAGMPSAQQDWTALQAFVTTAAQDDAMRGIVVADADGTIRASSNPRLIGRRYQSHDTESAILEQPDRRVTNVSDADGGGMRFVHPVNYAGVRFGTVDLVLKRDALNAVGDLHKGLQRKKPTRGSKDIDPTKEPPMAAKSAPERKDEFYARSFEHMFHQL